MGAPIGRPAPEPLVSVVLPTHDRPQRVGEALRSVLQQTYANLEVVIVDDASTVPVDRVVEEVAGTDRRPRLVRLPENAGAAGARNAALDGCSGELVAFIDDDDLWEPTKVARQVEYLQTHPDVGFVSCGHLIEREGSARGPLRFRGASGYTANELLWVNFAGSFSFVMARRALVGEELRIDEGFESVEDWDLWLRCARLAHPGVVREPLVRYVSHSGSRLTDTATKRRGLEAFEQKHGSAMSPACRAFHRAHQRMDTGTGWVKRAHVLGALATGSAAASTLLVAEQVARQLGRAAGDPGLAERMLARALRAGSTARALGVHQ